MESSGVDNIPIKMYKASGEEGNKLFLKICKMVWKMKQGPRDWCRAIFVPLPKKGDKKGVQITGQLSYYSCK